MLAQQNIQPFNDAAPWAMGRRWPARTILTETNKKHYSRSNYSH